MARCGIDLGTKFSAISWFDELNRQFVTIDLNCENGNQRLPSAVYYPGRAKPPVVGSIAVNASAVEPERVCVDVTRVLGRDDWTFSPGDGEKYRPADVAAEILKTLIRSAEEYLSEPVEEVVIAVPACFAQAQRHDMREASVRAGLDRGKAKLLPAPEAVAMAYYVDTGRDTADEYFLVYDLGGGTFDVALIHAQKTGDDGNKGLEFDMVCQSGDMALGGSRWTERLAETVAEKILAKHGVDPRSDPHDCAVLMELAESGKKMLSQATTASIVGDRQGHHAVVSRREFEDATSDLLHQTESIVEQLLAELRERGTIHRDCIDVILGGGASQMPMVEEMIARVIGKAPLRHRRSDCLVSMGAAFFAYAVSAATRAHAASQSSIARRAETPDVFISYRRKDGSQTARLLRAELERRGYRVFLDVDDLRPGHFDEALLRQIDAAPNFVLVLSEHSLQRCSADRDWLRREIAHAIEADKNIVPIIMPGFEFPESEELPEDIASLPLHHGIPFSHDFFDAMMDKLAGYLES